MLYDPKWNAPIDFDDAVSRTRALVEWLERHPAGKYDPTKHRSCLLAQWVESIDPLARPTPQSTSFHYTVNGKIRDLNWAEDIVFPGVGGAYTFTKALKSAKKLLKQVEQKG